MRYSCLLLDHDDTTIDSTPVVHYRAHLEQMRRLGRHAEALSLEQWYRVNFHPGIRHYLEKQLQLSPDEQQLCYSIWREFTTTELPPFFDHLLLFLSHFKAAGGVLAVVSHSEPDVILRHYRSQSEVPGLEPDEIFGWMGDPKKNKPYLWPVERMEQLYGFTREEMLVVDDLKPGIVMAREAGVASVGVGWSHRIPELRGHLEQIATWYAESIPELEHIVWHGRGTASPETSGSFGS